MKKSLILTIFSSFLLFGLISGCTDEKKEDKSVTTLLGLSLFAIPQTPTTTCETTFTEGATIQSLCTPEAGSGKHFRLEGVQTSASHETVYFYLGLPAGTTGTAAPAVTTGVFRLTLYHGCPAGCGPAPLPPQSYTNYGDATNVNTTTALANYTTSPSTVCIDINQTTPPQVMIWSTGINGADCLDSSTLTAGTSILNKSDWGNANALTTLNAFVKAGAVGGKLTKVVISSNSVFE
ncbi:hypothetical protein AB3N59_04315 [Leptospira sp. WS92.C1]